MRTATASLPVRLSPLVSLVVAMFLAALASPASAQDATKAEAAAPTATQSDATSERQQRRERRQAETAAKEADTAAGVKSDTLTKFPKAEEANAAATKQKMECRKQPVTGSRLGKTICATPEQWAQADKEAAEAVRLMKTDVGNKAGIERPTANPFGGAVGR